MYRAYGELIVQVSVDVASEKREGAVHTVTADINDIASDIKEIIITTVDGKEYSVSVNEFQVTWDGIVKKPKRTLKKNNLVS